MAVRPYQSHEFGHYKVYAVPSRNVRPTENNNNSIWSDYRVVICGSGHLFHQMAESR